MKETQSGPDSITQAGKDAFRYFLSAFLSAARSVTKLPSERNVNDKHYQFNDWVMEKEFGSAKGFDDWYQEKYDQLKGDQVMKFLKTQRDITIHFKDHKSIELQGNSEVNSIVTNPVKSTGVMVSTPVDATEEERQQLIARATPPEPPPAPVIPTETIHKQSWFFDELQKEELPSEVVPVCEEHIAKLEQLVDECERLFPLK